MERDDCFEVSQISSSVVYLKAIIFLNSWLKIVIDLQDDRH